MNVLLVGSGGREHALAWKIAQSPTLARLVAAPGNPGIAEVCECRPVGVTEVEALVALAQEIAADLVVVGPEVALEAGLADRLAEIGVPCFGPTRAAAQLETSKSFTRAFADRHRLPGTPYVAVEGDAEAAAWVLSGFEAPWVVKADGLAAGKGVVVTEDLSEARQALMRALESPGGRVVVEGYLHGEEVSLFALCDGHTAMLFGAAQDHKRAYDGDEGPNTGGMGTYSPAPIANAELLDQGLQRLVAPTVAGMAAEGAPYRGVLFAGLMVMEDGPRLVEFNARFGDPECQVLMLRLESDLLPYLHASATGALKTLPPPTWRDEAALCVVLAARGYPDAPEKGSVIAGLDQDFGEGVTVFHAGTARRGDGALIAAGGRVLNVCARGATLVEARARAYAAIARIDWPEGFHRTDIGWRALP